MDDKYASVHFGEIPLCKQGRRAQEPKLVNTLEEWRSLEHERQCMFCRFILRRRGYDLVP